MNENQQKAVETALIPGHKLLLVHGPPGKLSHQFVHTRIIYFVGTGKSMVCVEMIRRFVDQNYKGRSVTKKLVRGKNRSGRTMFGRRNLVRPD